MKLSTSNSSIRFVHFALAFTLSAGTALTQEPTTERHSSDVVRYRLIDLGTLSGGFSQASYINNSGVIVGNANVTIGAGTSVSHATVWFGDRSWTSPQISNPDLTAPRMTSMTLA